MEKTQCKSDEILIEVWDDGRSSSVADQSNYKNKWNVEQQVVWKLFMKFASDNWKKIEQENHLNFSL